MTEESQSPGRNEGGTDELRASKLGYLLSSTVPLEVPLSTSGGFESGRKRRQVRQLGRKV